MKNLIDPETIAEVELIDGLGRRRVSFNTTSITATITEGKLTIIHDGDSMDSTLTQEDQQ